MTDRHTQYLAVTLIALAAVCIAVGEMHNWIHMIDFANAFGGAGVGILTGQRMSNLTNKDGGTINVQTPDPNAPTT
jgi:hypothetical protein